MKKINMGTKTKKVVKTVASVGCVVAVAGLAYVIGFRAGGNNCAAIINMALNQHGDTFSIHDHGHNITRVSYEYGLISQKLHTYGPSED